MQTLLQDLRYAVRVLSKSPAFTIVAILTLALGIGANTSMFSIVNSVLLRPLAYPGSDRLVRLYTYDAHRDAEDMTFGELVDLQARSRSFDALASTWQNDANLLDRNGPEKIRSAFATSNLFPILGIRATLGRLFRSADDRIGFEPVALLSYGFWQRRYGGDPSIIGTSIAVDDAAYTVIGVLPRGFRYPGATDVWLPMGAGEKYLIAFHDNRRIRAMETLARLQPGISLQKAGADVSRVMDQLAHEYPDTDQGWQARLRLLQDDTVGNSRRGLLILMGAAGLVLLVACANLAGLLLARSAGRAKEFAIRGALGGSRWRLVRQMLSESLLLGALGGVAGALLASASESAILAIAPHDLPRLDEIRLDWRVFAFAFAVSLITSVAFGLAPAISATKINLQKTLKSGGRPSDGGGNPRLRQLLIVGEISIALILLVGSALLAQSFLRLLQVRPGYNPQNVISATVGFPDSYPGAKEQVPFAKRVIANLKSVPGVTDVAGTSLLPLVNFKRQNEAVVLDGALADRTRERNMNITVATPDFFSAMQIPLVAGRIFSEADASSRSSVAVISETAARSFWPGQNPLGKHLRFNWTAKQDREVIGVVGDVKQNSLAAASEPEMYLPFYDLGYSYLTFVARTQQNPAAFAKILADEIHKVDSTIAVYDVQTLDQLISSSIDPNRFYLQLIGGFGLAALALAAIGIYGLISFSVAQRTHEMGIRLALGALPRQLARMIVGQGLWLAIIGLTLGLLASLILGRVFSTLLFGVRATDPVTLVIVSLVLTGVALLACYVPARRAMRVDPIIALRHE